MRWLRLMWAAPASLLGLLLAPFFASRRRRDGILLCEGARWPRRIGWRYRAVTFGHVVLSVDQLDDETWNHEVAHVRQYERWGPFLIPAYGIASAACLVRGRHPYRDNPFERAACANSSNSGSLPMGG